MKRNQRCLPAQLICAFVLEYAKVMFSHDVAHVKQFYSVIKSSAFRCPLADSYEIMARIGFNNITFRPW